MRPSFAQTRRQTPNTTIPRKPPSTQHTCASVPTLTSCDCESLGMSADVAQCANGQESQEGQSFLFYRYDPSVPAAVIFVVIFAATTFLHTYQLFRTRTWYFIPFLIGGYCKSPSMAMFKNHFSLMVQIQSSGSDTSAESSLVDKTFTVGLFLRISYKPLLYYLHQPSSLQVYIWSSGGSSCSLMARNMRSSGENG